VDVRQDTEAYKKAADEQLRHRDALEKEIRQRDADKIQREAGTVPVGVTESPRRRGARPKYPWGVMEAKTYQLMGYQPRGRKPQELGFHGPATDQDSTT
jgi:hypothetical protein